MSALFKTDGPLEKFCGNTLPWDLSVTVERTSPEAGRQVAPVATVAPAAAALGAVLGAGKSNIARSRIKEGGFQIPSPGEIKAKMTPAGAWTAAQLAEWGILWPPANGWRAYLNAIYAQEGPAIHDTVFDAGFRDRWMHAGRRARLVNVRGIR